MCVSQGSATLSVSGGGIDGNWASNSGGGVYVHDGSVTFSGTQMISNSANYGGGMYVDQGSATMTGTQVLSNSAQFECGGVYVSQASATLSMSGGQIGSNSAGSGGGIYVLQGGATLSGTQVVSNSALHFGGGVYVDQISATLSVSGGGIDGNWASSSGGGVYVVYGSVTLSGTQVVSNSANYGGGVYVYFGSVTLSGMQVVSNSAVEGGGLYVSQGIATLNVSGGGIDGNSANNGGGVYVFLGSAMLSETQVVSNSAFYRGGGVYVREGSATLSGMQVVSNSANNDGGGVYVYNGSATLSGTQITANDAPDGSALYIAGAGAITPTTALTITGDVYQAGGRFSGSNHDLRVEGSLSLAGGDFYAPDAPDNFVLSGPFTHTGGTYHQTQLVNGSGDVGFPKAGGALLDANGLDLGNTEVALTAGADCAGVPAGEAVRHCYVITPTNASGRNAAITFFYRTGERFPGHACAAMDAYRWSGAWDTPLARDVVYGSDGRLCGPEPQSLRVTGVSTFSPFVLRGPAADARISKVVTPGQAVSGQPVTYTLIFSNAGIITATGVVITDIIPVSVTHSSLNVDSNVIITATGSISYVWEVVDLAPGAGGIITITGVLSHGLSAGPFTNTATITSTAIDSDVTNNSDSASVTVLTVAEITVHPLDLAFGNQDVDAGATVSQTVTITNDGGADLHISGVVPTGDTGEFNLSDSGIAGNGTITLTSGSARVIEVSFDPSSVGAKTVTLSIHSDDADESTVDVALTGTGGVLHYYVYLPLVVKND
ncbi:MAG: choice-of-anchor D domain-containing protein [bacterium]|nr:choice-of-anchor D domain-containing protein [bacterium]